MLTIPWRGLRALSLALLVFYLANPALGQAGDRPAYKLGIGDKLRVTVYGEAELSGEFTVNDQGEVALSLIGPVEVAGDTLGEAQDLIAQEYAANYLVNPRIAIEVLNYRPFYIIGEVNRPGSYPYQNGLTIIDAIALAGGYTARADKRDIEIKRAGDPQAGEQRIGEDGAVLPGDVIRVTERFF